MNRFLPNPGCSAGSCPIPTTGGHQPTVGSPGPRPSRWPVTGSVPMTQLERSPIQTVGAPAPFNVFRGNGSPDPVKIEAWLKSVAQGNQGGQGGQAVAPPQAVVTPVGPGAAVQPNAQASPYGAISPCPPGPAAGSEQFRFAAYYAQRSVQDLILKLQRPWSQAGTATTHRWEDGKDHGFMGDKPNRKHHMNPGSHPDIATHDRTRRLDVPQGTRAYLWEGKNFQGQRFGPYGPGRHNIPNVKSGLVTPDLDIDEMIRMALAQLQTLSCPANGCVINASNYETHPAVVAFVQFLDRVIALYGRTSLAQELEQKKTQLLANLARGVLASQGVCGGKAANAPVANAAGGEQCGVGVTPLTPAQIQTIHGQGTAYRIGKSLSDGRVCVRIGYAPKPGQAGSAGSGVTNAGGNRRTKLQGPCPNGNFYGECLTPQEQQCVAQGGRMQGRVNRRTQRLENLRCLRPGAGMIMQDVSTLPTRVPGQAYSQQRVAPVRVPLDQLMSQQRSGQSQPGYSPPGQQQPYFPPAAPPPAPINPPMPAPPGQQYGNLPPGFQQFPG